MNDDRRRWQRRRWENRKEKGEGKEVLKRRGGKGELEEGEEREEELMSWKG